MAATLICFGAGLQLADESPKSMPKRLAAEDVAALPRQFQQLLPLHKALAAPNPGDWLDQHEEAGETYRQFLAGRPVRATGNRRTIYVQPLGDFSADEQKIVQLTAEYLRRFFQLPVKVNEGWPLTKVPDEARRNHPQTGEPQVLSTYVFDKLLKPRLQDDAATMIALTNADLWPGEGWNFVFGQASLSDRVGVWSMHRFGDPSAGDAAFRLTLRRTLKTASHETGHMFSMPHCVYFECVMNGSNHLAETDARPMWLCPECLAKLCYATGAPPKKRFEELAAFAREQKLMAELTLWEQSLQALSGQGEDGH